MNPLTLEGKILFSAPEALGINPHLCPRPLPLFYFCAQLHFSGLHHSEASPKRFALILSLHSESSRSEPTPSQEGGGGGEKEVEKTYKQIAPKLLSQPLFRCKLVTRKPKTWHPDTHWGQLESKAILSELRMLNKKNNRMGSWE